MNKTKRHILFVILVITLLAIPTFVVFAKELGSLTISGPGIKGEMTINHPGGMMKLEQSGFFDQLKAVKPPENLGAGYNITANLNLDGKVVPFVQMVYYAADGDQPGYVHYTARLNGESLKPVDEWGQVNKEAYQAFRGLMGMYNIKLQPAFTVAAAAPAVEPAVAAPGATPAVSRLPNQVILALVAAVLVLLGAVVILRRRGLSQRSPQL